MNKNPTTKKTLSAAERQAKSDERGRKKAEAKRLADLAEANRKDVFENLKELNWLRLWSRALQMAILINEETLLESKGGSYWVDSLKVNATPGFERIEHDSLNEAVTPANFSIDNVDQLTRVIDAAFEERACEIERRNQKMREEERVARVRKGALEKLTSEEREVLDLR